MTTSIKAKLSKDKLVFLEIYYKDALLLTFYLVTSMFLKRFKINMFEMDVATFF